MTNGIDNANEAESTHPQIPRRVSKRRLLVLKRLLLVLMGVVAGCLFGEIALRILGIGYPLPFLADEYCGSRMIPGFEGNWTKAGGARFKINSAGFRDRERTPQKPPDTFRIAVLGDSFTAALEVPLDSTFCATLENRLAGSKAMSGRKVEVLNFGVSGHGTAQQLLMLRHYVREYAPDVVLLAFFPGNDVADNSRPLSAYRVKPFFTLDAGKLVLDDSYRRHPDFIKARSGWTSFKIGLINRSRVLQLIAQLRSARRAVVDPDVNSQGDGASVNDLAFVKPTNPVWRAAWQVTEALLARMHKEVAALDATFVLLTLSNPIQVHPDRKRRRAYIRRLGITDLFYCERRLKSLAERNSFPFIALGKPMQNYADKTSVFLHGFENSHLGEGHWNADGHRLAADLISKRLIQILAERDAAP